MKITVAGVGYVGLSLAVLLAQHNEVTAITTTPEKAEKLNNWVSPIQDDEIERFMAEAKAGRRRLHLHTTTDKAAAYTNSMTSLSDEDAAEMASAQLASMPGMSLAGRCEAAFFSASKAMRAL